MPIAVIADAHLGGPGGPAEELVQQLEGLSAENCQRLILLGDIFHVWVGLRSFETPEVRAVMAAIDRLRERGVPVDYVEGNRDFFLASGPYARHFDAVVLETSFSSQGGKVLAVHGDGLNDQDLRYRFWRWLSKSSPVRFLVRCLPGALARRLVRSTETQLSKTNFRHKTRIPEEAIRAYGDQRLAEGFDVLILGHFHEPHQYPLDHGEVRLLDAWFRSRRIEWFA